MNPKDDKTRLIILGAGASVDCGLYPTGAQFVDLAKKVLSVCDSGYVNRWMATIDGSDQERYKIFIRDEVRGYLQNFINSNHSSIDSHISYIASDSEQIFLKSLIVSIILSSTAYSDLVGNFKENCYAELSKLIFPALSIDISEEDKLSGIKEKLEFLQVVTFNYDVSLEIYLRQSVERYFGGFSERAKEAFGRIIGKIFHVYGEIYSSDDLQADSRAIDSIEEWKRYWNMHISPDYKDSFVIEKEMTKFLRKDGLLLENFCFLILQYAIKINFNEDSKSSLNYNRIKVIGEERGKIEEKVGKIIKNIPDFLYILGYGFDGQNNNLLEFDTLKYSQNIFVTNFGNNQKVERVIYDLLSSRDSAYGPDIVYKIPLISHDTVNGALKNDFSFFEEKSLLKIKTPVTPFLEMRDLSRVNLQANPETKN